VTRPSPNPLDHDRRPARSYLCRTLVSLRARVDGPQGHQNWLRMSGTRSALYLRTWDDKRSWVVGDRQTGYAVLPRSEFESCPIDEDLGRSKLTKLMACPPNYLVKDSPGSFPEGVGGRGNRKLG